MFVMNQQSILISEESLRYSIYVRVLLLSYALQIDAPNRRISTIHEIVSDAVAVSIYRSHDYLTKCINEFSALKVID